MRPVHAADYRADNVQILFHIQRQVYGAKVFTGLEIKYFKLAAIPVKIFRDMLQVIRIFHHPVSSFKSFRGQNLYRLS